MFVVDQIGEALARLSSAVFRSSSTVVAPVDLERPNKRIQGASQIKFYEMVDLLRVKTESIRTAKVMENFPWLNAVSIFV